MYCPQIIQIIENKYTVPGIIRKQLFRVLEEYKVFLKGSYWKAKYSPKPIEVEYIAECQEAVDMFNQIDGRQQVPYRPDMELVQKYQALEKLTQRRKGKKSKRS